MGLSDLTNKELKNILRQNNVKNYSKFNKKDLVKMVNQLINAQNGGKNGKKKNGKNKYKLKDLIGGEPPDSNQPLLSKENRFTNNKMKQGSYEPPSVKSIPITNSERKAFLQNQQQKEQQQQEQQQQEQQPQDQQQQEQQQQEQQQQPKNNSANNLPVKSLNKNYANKIIQKNQSQSNIVPDSVETIVNNQEKCKACTIL